MRDMTLINPAKKGLVIKRRGGEAVPLSVLREALNALIETYKPHMIKKPTFWRWSFSVPFEVEFEYAHGVQMVVEWHKSSKYDLEWLSVETKEKSWKKGHFPPCLW